MIHRIQTLPLPIKIVFWLLLVYFLITPVVIYWASAVLYPSYDDTGEMDIGEKFSMYVNDRQLMLLLFMAFFYLIFLPLAFLWGLIAGVNFIRWIMLIMAFATVLAGLFEFTDFVIGISDEEYMPEQVFANIIHTIVYSVTIWGLLHRDTKPHFIKKRR